MQLSDKRGATLVEALVACFLVALGALGLAESHCSSLHTEVTIEQRLGKTFASSFEKAELANAACGESPGGGGLFTVRECRLHSTARRSEDVLITILQP